MIDNLINSIQENVIQGRVTKDNEGLEEGMVGQPAVIELVEEALAKKLNIKQIINEGLTSGMDTVGQEYRVNTAPRSRLHGEGFGQ